MRNAPDYLVYILLDFLLVAVSLCFGTGFIWNDLVLAAKRGGTQPAWYFRIYIILGSAILLNALGNLLPAGLMCLIVFHATVIPLSQTYAQIMYTDYRLLNFVGLFSLLIFCLFFLWAAIAGLILKRHGREH